ncbi:hypothetical protein SAMN06265795_10756 [Noviherbaspirillum humi]|uniref:Uncharacterized protein n=1 Tax=Noviherbaspirillum humi TaxID=1688639 RepID=A0A239HN31_9BURK|nr:hypothetical protein [Noviherbaspirillum humi]SNS82263.1 hypothetical protein SAMN06265795_10756 [Noviherbaspirillum humi]
MDMNPLLNEPVSSASPDNVGSDVASLFSSASRYGSASSYRETVLHDTARMAASRWPLLAEIEGVHLPTDPLTDTAPFSSTAMEPSTAALAA